MAQKGEAQQKTTRPFCSLRTGTFISRPRNEFFVATSFKLRVIKYFKNLVFDVI